MRRWIAATLCTTAVLLAVQLWPAAPGPPQDRPVQIAPDPRADDDPLRIAILGTSLTARYDWPARLEVRLADCLGRPVRVTPLARPGANVAWGRGQAATVLETRPDMLLIEFTINDSDLRDGLSAERSRALHLELLGQLRRARPDDLAIALMTMSPATGVRGWLRPRLGARYRDYRQMAQDAGVGLIDLYPRWMALDRSARGLGEDGLHPDTEVAADVIVPALTSYLARAVGVDCPDRPPGSAR